NEWYKAAYYSPSNSTYYDFPNGSDTAPVAVASGIDENTAVYEQPIGQGPADVNQTGGLSPYGGMGLGGNVWEWEESSIDLSNSSSSSPRGFRGGLWFLNSTYLSSATRDGSFDGPSDGNSYFGFRVATNGGSGGGAGGGGGEVPEPSTLAIFGLGALGMASRSRRRKST
ncbi:MAG: PEP-CTERM sorting domain-containing protein, partial [Pirellula sp.]